LSAANVITLVNGATVTAMFFLLTLYMQEVLRYSAVETGVGFVAIGVTMVVVSNAAQALTTRIGVRPVLSAGLLLTGGAAALFAQLPTGGHYFVNVLPGLLLGGIGLALCFIPVTIASMSGVQPADAGVASGLLNTNRQIGGAVGLATVITVAASATRSYAHGHATLVSGGPALTHGFQVAFYVLVGLSLAGAAIAAVFIESAPKPASVARVEPEEVVLAEAA
jgi:MFS family permease